MANLVYVGLCAAQLLTLCAYVVVTVGAALLQKQANNLPLWNGLSGKTLDDTIAVYNEVFQNTQYIIPYAQQPQYQFQAQWFIIQFQLCIFVLTLALTVFPSLIPRLRPVALTFLASAWVLVFDNINAIFYLLRNDTAKAVFGEYRIATAQAGLIMVGVANGLTIIFLGAYQPEAERGQAYSADAAATIKV